MLEGAGVATHAETRAADPADAIGSVWSCSPRKVRLAARHSLELAAALVAARAILRQLSIAPRAAAARSIAVPRRAATSMSAPVIVTAEVLTAKLQAASELQPLAEVHVEDVSGAARGARLAEGSLWRRPACARAAASRA